MSETSTTHSGQPSAGGRGPLRAPSFSLGRIWTLATSTFTQLVRMKTFYFLIVFALVVVAVGNLDLLYTAEQKLRVIKNTAFGAMSVFSWLFAIAATAMLLPRDLEDRTLYTILSKPVPRLEYLLGKLGGVMLTIAIALLAMQALFTGVLWVQEKIALADAYADMKAHSNFTEAEIQTRLRMVAEQGVSWGLLSALWAIFLKALVVTSFTLLISTFASSSLFTIIVGVIVFIIGHFHKMAVSYWSSALGEGALAKVFLKPVELIFPDLRLFNIVENIVGGQPVALTALAEMTGLSVLYAAVYTMIGLYLFIDKEF